jgi:hypothetical protein
MRSFGPYHPGVQPSASGTFIPLSDAESEQIGRHVVALLPAWRAQPRFGAILRLIEMYPATTAVWLARKAGEA